MKTSKSEVSIEEAERIVLRNHGDQTILALVATATGNGEPSEIAAGALEAIAKDLEILSLAVVSSTDEHGEMSRAYIASNLARIAMRAEAMAKLGQWIAKSKREGAPKPVVANDADLGQAAE